MPFSLEECPPIVVTGLGRSGTTITGELLARHSDVELRFEQSGSRVAAAGPADRGELGPQQIERLRKPMRRWYTPKGRKHVLDKDPRWVFRLRALHEICPEARVLYMLRDGRDVACSAVAGLKKKGRAFRDWVTKNRALAPSYPKMLELPHRAAVVALWHNVVRADLQYALSSSGWDRFHIVRYEELIGDDGETARELFDWLKLPMQPNVEAFLPYLSDDVSVHVSKQSAGLFVKNHTHRIGRWENEFTEEDRAALPRETLDFLASLGY